MKEITSIVEALIFASEEEITVKQIKEVLESFSFKMTVSEIEDVIEKLNEDYKERNKPYLIRKVAGGFQFATKKEYGVFVGKLFTEKQKKKLSQSSIETLAIIAYKQPITRSEIEFIRGVNVDYIVSSLLERDLIAITGRADSPGRPILYGTTKNFLKALGINSLDELPKLKEINDILKNEKIEGITEADIDLFNSLTAGMREKAMESEMLDFKEDIKEADASNENISEDESSDEQISDEERNESSDLNG